MTGSARSANVRQLSKRRKGEETSLTTIQNLACSNSGGLLPEGLAFPFDFGFIPSTLGDDGDPLDVMVLMDEPAHVGCLLDVRIIGVIEAVQVQDGKSETNNRLIAVSIHSYDHSELSSLDEINSSMLDQVEEFFISYNKSRGKKFKIKGRHGPKRASELLEIGMRAFQKKKP